MEGRATWKDCMMEYVGGKIRSQAMHIVVKVASAAESYLRLPQAGYLKICVIILCFFQPRKMFCSVFCIRMLTILRFSPAVPGS